MKTQLPALFQTISVTEVSQIGKEKDKVEQKAVCDLGSQSFHHSSKVFPHQGEAATHPVCSHRWSEWRQEQGTQWQLQQQSLQADVGTERSGVVKDENGRELIQGSGKCSDLFLLTPRAEGRVSVVSYILSYILSVKYHASSDSVNNYSGRDSSESWAAQSHAQVLFLTSPNYLMFLLGLALCPLILSSFFASC